MTILGKFFTMLILVMSVVFMSFASMVFITHKNWKEHATNTNTAGGKKLGLEQQLVAERETNKQLRAELERAKNTLETEQAARRAVLAALQIKASSLEKELSAKEGELQTLIANFGVASEALKTSTTQLASLTEEVGTLRNDLKQTQLDRDTQFSAVVALTDTLNQAEGMKSRLDDRGRQLAGQLSQFKHLLTIHGISLEYPPKSKPLPVDGIVSKVGKDDLVEITLGHDDGLKEGHEVDIYRGNTYVARMVIRKTEPDKSVGQVDKKTQRGPIKPNDNVTTKFNK